MFNEHPLKYSKVIELYGFPAIYRGLMNIEEGKNPKMIEAICRWLVKKYNKNQATYCYCPGCGIELCGTKSWYAEENQLQRFRCLKCGHDSGWLFDVPCPILVEGRK